MNKKIAGTLLGVAMAGAGLTGFTITSALAQEAPADGEQPAQEAPERADGEGCDHGGRRAARAEELAEIIGISVDELREAREAGQTPAEIAEANGVSRDELTSALVDAAQEHLDEAVADGRLTQDEADERAAEIEEHVNSFVDGERPEGGPRGQDGADGEQGEDTDA